MECIPVVFDAIQVLAQFAHIMTLTVEAEDSLERVGEGFMEFLYDRGSSGRGARSQAA